MMEFVVDTCSWVMILCHIGVWLGYPCPLLREYDFPFLDRQILVISMLCQWGDSNPLPPYHPNPYVPPSKSPNHLITPRECSFLDNVLLSPLWSEFVFLLGKLQYKLYYENVIIYSHIWCFILFPFENLHFLSVFVYLLFFFGHVMHYLHFHFLSSFHLEHPPFVILRLVLILLYFICGISIQRFIPNRDSWNKLRKWRT